MMTDSANLAITAVQLPDLHPAPWNPRLIKDERFQNLCRSIQADPEFLWRRPILATADGTIYAGNMRYRAAEHLGMATVPAIVEDLPEQLAKERALRDNAQWGEWQGDQLAELVYDLKEMGSDLDLLGFDEWKIKDLVSSVSGPDFQPVGIDEQGRLDQKAPVTCPECGHVFTP